MDEKRWEHLQDLFHRAIDLPEDERGPFVEAACGADKELCDDLMLLLEEDGRSNDLLDGGLSSLAWRTIGAEETAPTFVGPYRIIRPVGKGGMGVVYLAERPDLGHRVAIKLLRDASLSPARKDRFLHEERMLAQLNHPSIAQLYDADSLPDGTPYFVMEYVEGRPLTDYCTENGCTLEERLRIFRSVCEAVQHAHRQAVIHRDIKPSNLFVSPDGTVKLLDFGIAKELESLESATHQTQTGLQMMTPAYASPEQLHGEPVGVYSDVYSLGVVLYELLTGRLPFDLVGRTPGQAEREILERDVERPSAVVRRKSGAAGVDWDEAGRRDWDELDVLCLTAMHRDPQRRYSSAEALARDVDHFLREEPLDARPDSSGYRLRKFLERNRQAALSASIVIASVLALVTFYTMELASARDAALAEAARTQRIQRFMLELFRGGEDVVGPADTLRVVTLIGEGVRQARMLDSEPDVQAELYHTLGTIYAQLGDFDAADSLLQAALDERRSLYGRNHGEVAASLASLGMLRVRQARLEEADYILDEAVSQARAQLPSDHPTVAEAVSALGHLLQTRGDYDDAVVAFEEAVRLFAARGAGSGEVSQALADLADTHFYAGRYAQSDSINQLSLAIDEQLYGRRHPRVASTLVNMGATRFQLGYLDAAERLYRQALEIYLPYHGTDHPATASNMVLLAQTLVRQGRHEEAAKLLEPAMETSIKVFGENHPKVAHIHNELAGIAVEAGDLDAAEMHYVRMTEIYREAYADQHHYVGIALSNLSNILWYRGKREEAVATLREAAERIAEGVGESHFETATVRIKLGKMLVRLGEYGEAERHLLAGEAVIAEQASPSILWLREAYTELTSVYEALDEPEREAHYRRALAATLRGSLRGSGLDL